MNIDLTSSQNIFSFIYKRILSKLYYQVIIGLILGVLLGIFNPAIAIDMKPLGDGFIKLIKMIIAPIIFCTIVTGIAGMQSMKQVGRVGGKALLYFEVITTVALILGLVSINLFKPGIGMNVDVSTLDTSSLNMIIDKSSAAHSVQDFFMNIIPNSFVGAFTGNDLLPVLLCSILFAICINTAGEKAKPVYTLIESFSQILFKMVNLIMYLAPIGAFGAIAFTIGKYGISSMMYIINFVLVFYATCLIFIFAILGVVLKLTTGFDIISVIKHIKEEFLIVLGTSSTESVLPQIMNKLEKTGCRKKIVGMVIPMGYSFNLDGSSIYFTLAAVFIAQATNTPLSLGDQMLLLSVLLITSKGAAGVYGSAVIVLAGTLGTVSDIPVEGIALILGVDRFMSLGRALTNLIGNTVATLIISKWEKELDMDKAYNAIYKKEDAVDIQEVLPKKVENASSDEKFRHVDEEMIT